MNDQATGDRGPNRRSIHLAELPIRDVRRALFTLSLFLGVLAAFIYMVHEMFVALVAGAYTFGVPEIVIGPIIVGLLKAIFDTITTDLDWLEPEDDGRKARVFAEEDVRDNAPPSERP